MSDTNTNTNEASTWKDVWNRIKDNLEYSTIAREAGSDFAVPLAGFIVWYAIGLILDLPFMGLGIGALCCAGLFYLDKFDYPDEMSMATLWCRSYTNVLISLTALFLAGLTPILLGPPKPTSLLSGFIAYFALLWFAATGRLVILIPQILSRGMGEGPNILTKISDAYNQIKTKYT